MYKIEYIYKKDFIDRYITNAIVARLDVVIFLYDLYETDRQKDYTWKKTPVGHYRIRTYDHK